MSKPILVVMAAGAGIRYGGLKQIDSIGPHGETILDYSIYDALKVGFGKVVFIIKENIEQAFREKVGKTVEKQCETVYIHQSIEDIPPGFRVPAHRQRPWGTGHAILSCKDVVNYPFAVINADDFYGPSSYQTLVNALKNARDRDGLYDYCMVSYVLENTLTEQGHVARGVCIARNGLLQEIHERTRIKSFGEVAKYTEDGEHWIAIPQGSLVSMNMWGFTPSLFSELETRFSLFLQTNSAHNTPQAEFFLSDIVGDILKEKKAAVKILPTNERWFGVTYRQDKPGAERAIRDLIRQGVYPEKLWVDVK